MRVDPFYVTNLAGSLDQTQANVFDRLGATRDRVGHSLIRSVRPIGIRLQRHLRTPYLLAGAL